MTGSPTVTNNNHTIEILATIERGDSEQIRITLEQFTAEDGQERPYCSARKWYKNKEGQWCPTKSGLSIRRTELMQWGKALRAALDRLNQGALYNTQPRQSRPTPEMRMLQRFAGDGEDLSVGGRL